MELFTRANLGPSYDVNTWCDLYTTSTKTSGAILFNFGVANATGIETSSENSIIVSARIIDSDGNSVAYIIVNTEVTNIGILAQNKIVLNPGDTIQIRANAVGCIFYASLTSNVKIA